jgi:hypothetical protein
MACSVQGATDGPSARRIAAAFHHHLPKRVEPSVLQAFLEQVASAQDRVAARSGAAP